MKILIIGSGGREHALAWTLAKDPDATKIYASPGNPGIEEIGTCVPISSTNVEELASFVAREHIDLTVVGPEAPLGAGIVDTFRKKKLPIFGPDKSAARIETSKSFAKDLCSRYNIPTPRWETFTDAAVAKRALDGMGPPWVVKADGLASGKGTTVTSERREAEAAIHRELEREPRRIVEKSSSTDGKQASQQQSPEAEPNGWHPSSKTTNRSTTGTSDPTLAGWESMRQSRSSPKLLLTR